MIVHPKISANSRIENPDMTPAGIDLRLGGVDRLTINKFCLHRNDDKDIKSETREVVPDEDNFYSLVPGCPYKIRFENEFDMASDEVGLVFPRSTLVRHGLILTSGIYDPGFRGTGYCTLAVVSGGLFMIQRGARIAHLLLVKAEAYTQYAGQYQAADGAWRDREIADDKTLCAYEQPAPNKTYTLRGKGDRGGYSTGMN